MSAKQSYSPNTGKKSQVLQARFSWDNLNMYL